MFAVLALPNYSLFSGESASFAAMFADWNGFACCRQRYGAFALPRRRCSKWLKREQLLKLLKSRTRQSSFRGGDCVERYERLGV